ncbi:MAG: site-specific integrase [Rhodobacteraceae bacterium]|nr:site-specific integrase [Paracoccaceae bacterium]
MKMPMPVGRIRDDIIDFLYKIYNIVYKQIKLIFTILFWKIALLGDRTMGEPVTQTETTKGSYRKNFTQLYQRACKEQGRDRIAFSDFVDWLEKRRPVLAKRTWWAYKAACLFCLDEIQSTTQQNLTPVIDRLQALTATPCPAKTTRTSGAKAKRLSQQDLLTLCLYLEGRSGVWGVRTSRWLLAGFATGLRPIEWVDCQWVVIERVRALQVKNAKATNDRAHGRHRHIIMPDWDDDIIDLMDTHRHELQTFHTQGRYYTYYDNCRTTLFRAARACFPGRKEYPSLYSARHQFAADMKRKHPAQMAAALMGHSTDKTVQRQYAQSRHGERRGAHGIPSLPLALYGEIARVEISQDVKQLLAHLQQAKVDLTPFVAPRSDLRKENR